MSRSEGAQRSNPLYTGELYTGELYRRRGYAPLIAMTITGSKLLYKQTGTQ